MSNGLSSSVSIPVYTADGVEGAGGWRDLTFSGGAPPTDGSVGLALIALSISGVGYAAGTLGGSPTQRLFYFAGTASGATSGGAKVTGGSGYDYVAVPQWACVANANNGD